MLTDFVAKLEKERDSIVWQSDDDEGASEWYCHLTDVIRALKSGTMTIKEAKASLGM